MHFNNFLGGAGATALIVQGAVLNKLLFEYSKNIIEAVEKGENVKDVKLNYDTDYIKTIFKEVLSSFQPQNILHQVKIGKEKSVNDKNEEIYINKESNDSIINKDNIDILTNLISNGLSFATGIIIFH
jgi:hypothetical protein